MNTLVLDRVQADRVFGGADQRYHTFLRYPRLDQPGWAIAEHREHNQSLEPIAADLAFNVNLAVDFMENLPAPLENLYRFLGFVAYGRTEGDTKLQTAWFPHPAVWGSRLADLFPLSSWLRGRRPPAFTAWGRGGYPFHAATEELALNGAFLVAVGGEEAHAMHDSMVHGMAQVLVPPKDIRRIRRRASRALGDHFDERALSGVDLDQLINITEFGASVKRALRDEAWEGIDPKQRLREEDIATVSWRRAARNLQTASGSSDGDWAVEQTMRRLRRHCYRLGQAAMKANQTLAA